MRKSPWVLLTALLISAVGCASAPESSISPEEEAPIVVPTKKDAPPSRSVRLSPQPSASFAGFDKNKDHVIAPREISRRERRVARLDLNKDRKITIMEFMKNPDMHAKKNKVRSFDKPGEKLPEKPVEPDFENHLENSDGGES